MTATQALACKVHKDNIMRKFKLSAFFVFFYELVLSLCT